MINNNIDRNTRTHFINANTIVIKVGTSTLIHKNGKFALTKIEKLAKDISQLISMGKKVVLVSSGAIGAGIGILGIENKLSTIKEKQAIAAVGQCELMNIYSKIFRKNNRHVGQMLLTANILENSERYENVVNTFDKLFELGIVPIVNHNDSVCVEEISYGNNDILAAMVAIITSADLLIILSDVEGLYDKDPRKHSDAKLIPEVSELTSTIKAGAEGSNRGIGGMKTKVIGASIAVGKGIDVVIANGEESGVIDKIVTGEEIGTFFIASK